MRILLLHAKRFSFEPIEKEIEIAEEAKKERKDFSNVLVCFTAIEENDNKGVIENAVKQVKKAMEEIGVKEVIIYPFAHLSNNLCKPSEAIKLFNLFYEELKKEVNASKAPFGWNKQFSIEIEKHPLAERLFVIKEGKAEEEKEEKSYEIYEALLINENGSIEDPFKVENEHVKAILLDEEGKFNEELKKKVKEIKIELKEGEPVHVKLAKKLRIAEKEKVADAGCLRFLHNGAFMFELIRRRNWEIHLNDSYGYPIITPTVITEEDEGVRWLINNFPERHYVVLPGKKEKRKEMFLKTAGDYGSFSIHRDLKESYRNLPVALVECETDFRYEQRGELRGMHRLREFHMQNVHTTCKDKEQGKEVFADMFRKFYKIMKDVEAIPDLLVFYSTKEFYEEFKDYLISLAKELNVKIVVFVLNVFHLYMGAWVDLIVFDNLNRPMEVATSQFDILSSKNWDIRYVDASNQEKHPIIIHAGHGYERLIGAMLEKKWREKKFYLPLWLSPIQVRIIPVSKKFTDYAYEVAKELEKNKIRVDLDDREMTLANKVREAEESWIPYIAIVGEKEMNNRSINVRNKEGDKREVKIEEFIKEINEKVKDYPRLGRFGPLEVSRRLK